MEVFDESIVPDIDDFISVAEAMKALADATRIRIFWLLCHKEMTGAEIAGTLNLSAPNVSHHLKALSMSGLATSRRDKKEVKYRIKDSRLSALLHKTIEELLEIKCPLL